MAETFQKPDSGSPEELARRILSAEGRSRLLPQLTLGLLHKLNNVMTSAFFTAEGCEIDIEENHPARESLRSLIESMHQAQQLIKLTAEVNLDLGSSDPEYHDLGATVHRELELCKMLLPKSAAVDLEIWPEPLLVHISIADLRRVLFSFATNARESAGQRPHIWIKVMPSSHFASVEAAPASFSLPKDSVVLSMRDNGAGLAAGDWERLTQAFFTTRPDHLGLGLFEASQAALRHGGQIGAVRNVPQGTEMLFVLPRLGE